MLLSLSRLAIISATAVDQSRIKTVDDKIPRGSCGIADEHGICNFSPAKGIDLQRTHAGSADIQIEPLFIAVQAIRNDLDRDTVRSGGCGRIHILAGTF